MTAYNEPINYNYPIPYNGVVTPTPISTGGGGMMPFEPSPWARPRYKLDDDDEAIALILAHLLDED